MMATFQTLKKYEHKLKARKRDAQLRPRDAEAVYKVGLVHLEYGRRPKAIEAFSQSLNRNPGFEAAAAKLRDLERETNQQATHEAQQSVYLAGSGLKPSFNETVCEAN